MSNLQPQLYTSKYLFKAVCDEAKKLCPRESNSYKILDVPAGAGALTKFLKEEIGATVSAADYDLKKWQYSEVTPKFCDLSKEIPFPDNTFDLVICLEGLKHIPNIHIALSEFQRVTKPGGKILITIPNDLNLQSRLRYFFDGFVDVDWTKPMQEGSDDEKLFMYPASLLSYPYLHYYLEKAGLKKLYTRHDRIRGYAALLAIFFYPFIFLKTLITCKSNIDLFFEMISPTWLCGRRNIIVCAKK